MSVPGVPGAPGSVASDVASVLPVACEAEVGVVADRSSVARGVGSTLVRCFQLVGHKKGILVWNVEVARSKGNLGRGERGPPPFLHADQEGG